MSEMLSDRLRDEVARLKRENEALRKDAALRRAVNRAAGELPEGYSVELSIERGAGTVCLRDDDGNFTSMDVDADDRVVAEIDAAIDAALAAREGA